MIRGDKPDIQGCEPLSKLVEQSTKGGSQLLFPSLSYRGSLTLYSSLWIILVLHLLVIHAYT